MQIDGAYTGLDHTFRDEDPYARAKYELTLRWLKNRLNAGSVVYNVGCGGGYFNALAADAGVRVVACEPDQEPFSLARRRATNNVTVLNCGLSDFASEREPADVVVMHDVLEHIADDANAVDRVASITKAGGLAVISVPALQSLFGLHDERLGHYRRYDARTLRRVLEPRFHVEKMQYYGMFSIPIVLWFSRWKRIPYPIGAGSQGSLGRAYAAICRAESYVPEPIGSSLIALLRPR